jgi:hypothetical protein
MHDLYTRSYHPPASLTLKMEFAMYTETFGTTSDQEIAELLKPELNISH